MINCHRSEMIETYIGRKVKVYFRNGSVEVGVVRNHVFCDGYILKCDDHDVRFYNSHVKKIELVCDRW